MIRRHGTTVKLAAFLAFAGLTALMLVNALSVSAGGDNPRNYTALFRDVGFLRAGSEVRIAGVRVGRVSQVDLNRDGTVIVDFSVDRTYRLAADTTVAIKYQNLLGDRYLELIQGDPAHGMLAEASTIPLARTSPPLDLDAVMGGFKPLFKALSPTDVNTLSANIIALLQSDGGDISGLMQTVGSLTNALADHDEVIGAVITNLGDTMGALDARSEHVDQVIVNLQEIVSGLAAERDPILTAIGRMNRLSHDTAALLAHIRPDLSNTILRLKQVSTTLNAKTTLVESALSGLGPAYDATAGIGLFGDFFNFHICDLRVKTTGPDGTPVYSPWIDSPRARCSGEPAGSTR